jgi:Flp pilus assembly protein TadG
MHRGAGRRERGAALVEAALILPVVFSLLLGMFTGGLTYSRDNALNHAAREAGRYGATLVMTSESSWLTAVRTEVKQAATGDLDATVSGQFVCVAFVYPNGTVVGDRTISVSESSGVAGATTSNTCFADGRPASERRVQVLVRRRSEIQTIWFTRTVTLEARSVTRFERTG